MSSLHQLIEGISTARDQYLHAVSGLTRAQAIHQENASSWSILEITEHITIAEDVGVNGIWRAANAYREGTPLWAGNSPNQGLTIEEVVEQTWKQKENVPDVAAPRLGGSLHFWIHSLKSRQHVLEALAIALTDAPLHEIIYPHPISGPLDAHQRLEFLRFHLDRHRLQVERVKASAGF